MAASTGLYRSLVPAWRTSSATWIESRDNHLNLIKPERIYALERRQAGPEAFKFARWSVFAKVIYVFLRKTRSPPPLSTAL